MSEADELKTARELVSSGEKEKALPILLRLRTSNHLRVKLDAALALLVVLDHVTQNEELLSVTEEALATSSILEKADIHAYLLSQKAQFLFTRLSQLTYRQHNLNLAAGVFHWIGFSLELDKQDFEAIIVNRSELKREIRALEESVVAAVRRSNNHYMNGHVLMALGEVSFSRMLDDKLDLYRGGKFRSRIMNLHFIRRWNLDTLVGYSRDLRVELRISQRQAETHFKEAIIEFQKGGYEAELAHALYSLAVKYALTFRFLSARKYLRHSQLLAEKIGDNSLVAPINALEKTIKDRYRHTRNWVKEFGLDLPRGLRRHEE